VSPDSTLGDAIWLAARSAGLVAYVLVGASTLLGLLQSTRTLAPQRRMALRPLHEALAVMSILAVVLHGALLLADPWLRPGLAGIVIPFASPYRPLAVALGVVGFYLTLLIGPTYYLRQRLGGQKRWRAVHTFAPAAYALVTLHVILAGSDASTVWLRFLVGALTGPILVLAGLRVLDAQASAESRPASRSSTASPSSEPSTTSASKV
jgi:sulfoxide reductase heme-binding subunit YedZ